MAVTETTRPDPDAHREHLEQARAALLDPAVEQIVEMVIGHDAETDTFDVAAPDGSVRFGRTPDGDHWRFEVLEVAGRDPLGNQDAGHLAPIESELGVRHPHRTANAYPYAFETIAQLFDAASPPDLISIHTAAHNWEDQGGHRGEHGSLDVIQARAPFIIAGAGVRSDGLVDRSCRLVDVAPTVAALMGVAERTGIGESGQVRESALLARQDGDVLGDVLAAGEAAPRHVVGFLLDGANANVLYAAAASGLAPNIARLMAMGTSYRHGAMSSLPTVTLANHTSILTGSHPGHHGILHNAWWDRATQQQIVTNSPAHWMTAMAGLDPGVETLFAAIERTWPGDVTASINEPCDTGATYTTMGRLRAGEMPDRPPAVIPHTTERFVRPDKEYTWSTKIDHTAVEQFVGLWSGQYGGQDWALPRFSWVNFSLTDAAFHEGGPHSEVAEAAVRDTDGRLGEVLAAVERSGRWDQTAFFLVADHGMEESNPEVTGNWADALNATGLSYRDEGYGFIYLNP